MDIFKNFAALVEKDMERQRAMKAAFEKENLEFFNSDKCQQLLHPGPTDPKVPDEQWDHNQAAAEGWGNMTDQEQSL